MFFLKSSQYDIRPFKKINSFICRLLSLRKYCSIKVTINNNDDDDGDDDDDNK